MAKSRADMVRKTFDEIYLTTEQRLFGKAKIAMWCESKVDDTDVRYVLGDKYATLTCQRDELELEKQILLEVFRRSHSEMDDEDYLSWYSCVVKMLRAFKEGKRGVDVTIEWDKHPELYEAPCYCHLCRSYGE